MTDEIRLGVRGMTCAACVSRVERAVAKLPGVVDVAVNLGVDPKHADQMVRGGVVLPHAAVCANVLAIDEACQNIIRHAYCGDEAGEIEAGFAEIARVGCDQLD